MCDLPPFQFWGPFLVWGPLVGWLVGNNRELERALEGSGEDGGGDWLLDVVLFAFQLVCSLGAFR